MTGPSQVKPLLRSLPLSQAHLPNATRSGDSAAVIVRRALPRCLVHVPSENQGPPLACAGLDLFRQSCVTQHTAVPMC